MSGVKKPVNQAKIKAVPDFCPIIKTQAANGRLNERLLPPILPSPKTYTDTAANTALAASNACILSKNGIKYGIQ